MAFDDSVPVVGVSNLPRGFHGIACFKFLRRFITSTMRPYRRNCVCISRVSKSAISLMLTIDAAVARSEAARLMRGLNDETLRAVVDPRWLTASGTFGPIHHRDVAPTAYWAHFVPQDDQHMPSP